MRTGEPIHPLVVVVVVVTFLPEELPGPEEGDGVLELPTDDVGPLIQLERQIAVRANPLHERERDR